MQLLALPSTLGSEQRGDKEGEGEGEGEGGGGEVEERGRAGGTFHPVKMQLQCWTMASLLSLGMTSNKA